MRYKLLIAAAVALITVAAPARADLIAVTSISGGSNFPAFNGTNQTIGWTFSSNAAISVTMLGFYDLTPASPLGQSHQVGLWDSLGTLLASATVGTTDPLDGSFRYSAITPVLLTAGLTYTIGAAITSPFSDIYNVPGTVTTSSGINLLGSARNGSSQGFSFPSTVTTGNGRIGPNFQYVETAVPEPMSLALLGGGLLALGLVRRRRAAQV